MTVIFTDGEQISCDYLIGCDGIRSVVRDHVLQSNDLPTIQPRFSGTWAYRGIIKHADYQQVISDLGNDPEIADVPQMFLGNNKHILTFPIRQGEEINIVAFKSDMCQKQLPLNIPWTMTVDKQTMLDDFADWSDSCIGLLNLIEQPTLWALHENAPIATYKNRFDNVVIIGDAAHAMLPHQGAGAGQGLEDALILSTLLSHSALTKDNIGLISGIYESLRLSRASRTQDTSRESGDIYELRSNTYPDFAKIGEHLTHRFDWLWQHRLEEDVLKAKTLLSESLRTLAVAG